MDTMKEYVLTLVAVAILCAVIQLFFAENKELLSAVKLVTGVAFMICALKPVVSFEWDKINSHLQSIDNNGSIIIAEAEEAVQMEMQERIIQETRAYILDEATSYGVMLDVDVQLNDDLIPAPYAVTLSGNVSPYIKNQLSRMLVNDLGIPEENQLWK